MKYSLSLIDNVPAVLSSNRKYLLLDTGSPNSFSNTGSIEIGGTHYSAPTSLGKVTADYLCTKMHNSEIGGLLGMNIISKAIYEFDYPNMMLGVTPFNDGVNESALEVLNLSYVMSIPIISVQTSAMSQPAKFILDTGAKFSYAIPEICESLQNIGTDIDFSPLIEDNLEVIRYSDLSYNIGAVSFQHVVHEAPGVTRTVKQLGAHGILGYHFMKERKITLNPNTNQLIIS
jgi:hypothetical protein